jgi:hypothetical protein
MINRHLPGYLGGLTGPQATALLEELAGRALAPGGPCGTVLLSAPEMVPVPAAYRRGDGLSLWRRHGAEVYTTRGQLDTETRLLRAAARTGAPEMTAAACRRWLADYLTGLEALLLATTNVQVAELARRARVELAALGLVERDDTVGLADGNVPGRVT